SEWRIGVVEALSLFAIRSLSLLHFLAMPLSTGIRPCARESPRAPRAPRAMPAVQVCTAADVPENSVISREVGDELVAIYNINGTYYATEARCTHGMADLADGTLDGEEIECTFHFGKFHVPSGKATESPCFIALKTFKTEVRDGQVFVDLDTPAPTAAA